MNYNLHTIRMCRGGGGLHCNSCHRYHAYIKCLLTARILRPVLTHFVVPLDPARCDNYFLPIHRP